MEDEIVEIQASTSTKLTASSAASDETKTQPYRSPPEVDKIETPYTEVPIPPNPYLPSSKG